MLLSRRLREVGKPADWTYEIVFAALIGGRWGRGIDYLIQNWDQVSDDLLGQHLSPARGWSGSAASWAAPSGCCCGRPGAAGSTWQMCDVNCLPLALGYTIGRVGCQLSGDGDYGIASDLPWAMAYPDGTVPTTEEVHPTPVYETLTMGFATLVLWHLRDRFAPGVLFGLYLVFAGGERLLVELVRRNDSVVAGLTQPQLISIGLLALGTAIILSRRSPRARTA